jgi:hypothetical protein
VIKDLKDLNLVNYHYYSTKEILIVTKDAHDALAIYKAYSSLKPVGAVNSHIEVMIYNIMNILLTGITFCDLFVLNRLEL